MAPLTRQQRQWVEQNLSLREREALIQKQAEPPNTGMTGNGYTFNNTRPGTYACALGGLPVFHSSAKVEISHGEALFQDALLTGGKGVRLCFFLSAHRCQPYFSPPDYGGNAAPRVRLPYHKVSLHAAAGRDNAC